MGEWKVETEARLRSHIGDAAPITREKVKPSLDADLRRWVEASPYVCVATMDREGRCDVSPRGDEPGFVRIVDDHTLVLPERPGNRLADTLSNILETGAIGMLFIVPGCPETLRVNGTAEIHDGPPELLESMAARGRVPKLAIVVRITDTYMHCGRAASRSRIWDPSMKWTSPHPERMLASMFGLEDTAAQEILDAYNSDEL